MGKHNLWLQELTFKELRPARAAEPSIKDAAIRGNWIGNDLRQRNGQPSIEEKLYVNRQHVHALNKYSQQKKKIMPSVDISTTTINKQRIALSGRFCWRNQSPRNQSMETTSMKTTGKINPKVDRILWQTQRKTTKSRQFSRQDSNTGTTRKTPKRWPG